MFRTGILRSLLSPVSRLGFALVELLGYVSAARLLPARCALAVGEPIPLRIRVLWFDYSRVTRVSTFEYFLAVPPASLRCLRNFGFVCVAWCCNPNFLAYPHGLPVVRYLYCFFRHVWYCSCVCHVAFALITRTIPAQVLPVALRSVAVVAVSSPIPRF